MSKLSELLNPAPQRSSSHLSTTDQHIAAPVSANTYTEGDQSIRSTYVFTGNTSRRQSITSPLDALVEAAANSAPMPSPSRPSPNFVDAHYPILPTPSSRPTSSHASPPRTFELPPVSSKSGHFSPGLERYHQANSNEVKARRMSTEMMEDKSRLLPPLTQIQPEKEPLAAVVNARSQILSEEKPNTSSSPLQSPNSHQPSGAPEPQSPVTTQIRKTSLGPVQPAEESIPPGSQTEQVEVKTEMMDAPPQMSTMTAQENTQAAGSPTPSSRRPSATPISKSIAGLKREASNRSTPVPAGIKSPTKASSAKPKAAPNKKRAAPKKGTASAVKQPAAKRRKVEKTESIPNTPAFPRNGTPSSSRASKTPIPKNRKQGSVTPARSSSVLNADEDDDYDEGDSMSIDENEQFCVCRGPDDHTWMIACDGVCDDWFHGRCVDIKETDGKLIDKYICPNCTASGHGQTLWKPMCRLPTCRKPARVTGSKPSKYCSEEHGIEFMRQLALRNEPPPSSSPKKPAPIFATGRRKSRKDNYTDNIDNEDDEGDTYLRGGILRPSELKALASSRDSIASFRALGDGVLSPPESLQAEEQSAATTTTTTVFTDAEKAQLADIKTKTQALKEKKKMLDDRETFLGMVKARAKSVADEMKKKEKGAAQLCGFDPRLAWADEEFEDWRGAQEGKAVFESGKLALAPEKKVNGLVEMDVDGDGGAGGGGGGGGEGGGGAAGGGDDICLRKRCPRHRDWARVQTNNLALDKDDVRVEMKRLLAEEKGVRERATIRSLEET